jgi:signal peptidase I
MTTKILKKTEDQEPKPLINPILQENPDVQSEPVFPKYTNSFEPEVQPVEKYSTEEIKKLKRFNLAGLILTVLGNLIVITLLSIFLIKIFVLQQVEVDGLSMFPNYNDRDFLLMNTIDKNLPRGQVVALYSNDKFAYKATHEMNPFDAYFARLDCKSPNDCNAKFFLKRIVGLPGEEIEVANGDVIIYNKENPTGSVLKEDYIPQSTKDSMKKTNYHFAKTAIPEGKFFVMGDNRTNSTDSRVIGSIADYAIFGKQVVRVGNFVNNKSGAFDTYKWFDLPKYDFNAIPDEDKALSTK